MVYFLFEKGLSEKMAVDATSITALVTISGRPNATPPDPHLNDKAYMKFLFKLWRFSFQYEIGAVFILPIFRILYKFDSRSVTSVSCKLFCLVMLLKTENS